MMLVPPSQRQQMCQSASSNPGIPGVGRAGPGPSMEFKWAQFDNALVIHSSRAKPIIRGLCV